jgi:hypothetical protein
MISIFKKRLNPIQPTPSTLNTNLKEFPEFKEKGGYEKNSSRAVVRHVYNPTIQEAKTGSSRV